ncbi:MAG: phage/plasmid primase, P4 family [Gammaproteobacteria bacterium]|nr:phage/plasmid primase, P4 family [Gammaproteobacteria bacterium]
MAVFQPVNAPALRRLLRQGKRRSSQAELDDLAVKEWEKMPAESTASEWLTDLLCEVLAWDDVGGYWVLCDGKTWQRCTEKRAQRVVKLVLLAALPDGFGLNPFRNVMVFFQGDYAVNEWNEGRHLLPLDNGVLDLTRQTLTPYTAGMWFNWRLPFAHNPKADCPTIKQWLHEATQGDESMVHFLRSWMKAVLTGRTDLQKYLELIGAGGTGKSTFLNLLSELVGIKNTFTTNLHNLEKNRFEGASIYGKRLLLITDSDSYGGEVANLKAMTGGDMIRYEAKGKQQREPFKPTCLVAIAANQVIQSKDYTSGLMRRRITLQFNHRPTERDKARFAGKKGGMLGVMKSELSGLLNWLLELSDDAVTEAINAPCQVVSDSTLEAMLDSNPVAQWVEDNCIYAPDTFTLNGSNTSAEDPALIASMLYPNYANWCEEAGHRPVTVRKLGAAVIDLCQTHKLDVKADRKKSGRGLMGLRLRTASDGAIRTPIMGYLSDTQSGDPSKISAIIS